MRSIQPLQHRARTRTCWMELSASSSASESENNDAEDPAAATNDDDDNGDEDDDNKKIGLIRRIRNSMAPKEDDGLTFRQRLQKMGLAVVLSYGFVSNMSYSISISLAWYIFSKQTRKSPLAPGQWKPFLAVYAGFWVINNVIRPARFALAVAVGTKFDRIVKALQNKLGVSKAVAIFVTVMLANVVGTLSVMSLGIVLASIASGVPIFP